MQTRCYFCVTKYFIVWQERKIVCSNQILHPVSPLFFQSIVLYIRLGSRNKLSRNCTDLRRRLHNGKTGENKGKVVPVLKSGAKSTAILVLYTKAACMHQLLLFAYTLVSSATFPHMLAKCSEYETCKQLYRRGYFFCSTMMLQFLRHIS